MLLLGTIAPALIAAGDGKRRGPWAGWVLSTGSAGGIVGALAAGLWLIPAVGLARTFVVLAFALALAAVPACVRPVRPAGLVCWRWPPWEESRAGRATFRPGWLNRHTARSRSAGIPPKKVLVMAFAADEPARWRNGAG